MSKLVAEDNSRSYFLPLGMPLKILLKNCKIVCATVHVTDLISTTYHYASKDKVWLIF